MKTGLQFGHTLLICVLLSPQVLAQATLVQEGVSFTKSQKGSIGDVYTVLDGVFAADGRHILYVEEGLTPKVVRLDTQLRPTEELVLKDLMVDGVKWTAVTPLVKGGSMQCLFVSVGKKGSEFAIGTVNTAAALSVTDLRKLVAFDLSYANDPSNTLPERPLPNPILFTRGLAYAQRERLVWSADGRHVLLNHYSHNGKGNKRFAFACLNADLGVLWQGNVELPYEDAKSTIHQVVFGNDGTIRLLTYVYRCKGEEEMGDKNCHELHVTTISDQGASVHDVLVDRGFVSSARILDREGGKVAIALRYGALTGQSGVVATFDPKEPKLKPTPVLDQRLPSIRKAKLMPYGDPAADPRKPVPRTAKLPLEVVDLLARPDGNMMVVETYLDHAFQLPVGYAVAMRRLGGAVRVSQVQANDSIGWQQVTERVLMTTAGQAYDGSTARPWNGGLLLLHGHTPRGYVGVLQAGRTAASNKVQEIEEPHVLRAAHLGLDGTIQREGTALLMKDGFVPCPMGVLFEPGGTRALVKSYDHGTQYRFSVIDLAKLGD